MLSKNNFLGVDITNENGDNILEYILQILKNDKKFYIVTPNPEILVYATRHKNFKTILNSAEISLADGIGLFLASIVMGKPLKQTIPGVEFIEFICKKTVRNPISIGFLGSGPGIALRTAECLDKKYPHLNIVFVAEEWSEAGFVWDIEKRKIDEAQEQKGPSHSFSSTPLHQIDLLFVAFGHPKQEEWIYNNLDKIPVKAAMGVGGALDYISGEVRRAPLAVRALGFEWLYRLIRQPWRWKRQLALVEFVKLVVIERFSKRNS